MDKHIKYAVIIRDFTSDEFNVQVTVQLKDKTKLFGHFDKSGYEHELEYKARLQLVFIPAENLNVVSRKYARTGTKDIRLCRIINAEDVVCISYRKPLSEHVLISHILEKTESNA